MSVRRNADLVSDGIRYVEELTADSAAASGYSGNVIVGDVEILRRGVKNGKVIFTRDRKHNELLLTGMTYLSEKVNNVRSRFKPTPIDVSLGCHTVDQVVDNDTTVPNEKLCGIMAGVGGSGDVYNTIAPVYRTDLTVPGMIPFRVRPVDDDLDEHTRAGYFLRTVRDGYVYYYGKRFTTGPDIEVLYDDGRVVDASSISRVQSSQLVKAMTRYTIRVDEFDMREYFRLTEGSTKRSRVNSIGLVAGYPQMVNENGHMVQDFFNVRGITTANMENKELKNSEDAVNFTYKLYFL